MHACMYACIFRKINKNKTKFQRKIQLMFDFIALVYIYSTDFFHGTLRHIFSKFYVLCCNDFVQKEAHMNADIS